LEFDYLRAGLSYGQMRTDVDGMVRSQVEAVREYDTDWAVLFPDDYIEFEPLGLPMRDDADHPAMPSAYWPMDREVLGRLRVPDRFDARRCPIHLEMLRKTKDALGDTTLVMGRVAAPFSTLGLVYGIDELMIGLLTDPELVRDNMRFFVQHQIAFGRAQLEAGADVLWLGDCCAGSAFISVPQFKEFAFEAAAEVVEALVKHGALVIYHTNETSLPHLAEQVQLPVHAVNVGEGPNLSEVKRSLDPEIALMGNFECLLLRDGSPAEIARETERVMRDAAPGGRFMLNTGEGVMGPTPPENVAAMIGTAKSLATELVG